MVKQTRDYEASTFQKRPCYRYIRASDNLPAVGEGTGIAAIKLFDPTGGWTWYISEYDPETRQAYGLVNGFEKELGYFDMGELIEFRGRIKVLGFRGHGSLPIERDLHWTPKPLSEC